MSGILSLWQVGRAAVVSSSIMYMSKEVQVCTSTRKTVIVIEYRAVNADAGESLTCNST